MVTAEHIITSLPPLDGGKKLLATEQVTDDIINAIYNKHNATAGQYDLISEKFWAGSAKETGRRLFDFLKKNTRYKAESNKQQTVKVPAAIIIDGINGKKNDCKHYASFIVGVVRSLNRKGYPIDAKYIFASDDEYKDYPTHTFAEVWDKNGRYWVDPVLKYFNEKHKYYYIHNDNNMLYDISGVNDQIGSSFNINKPFGDFGKAVKVNVDNLKKGANIAVNDIKKGAVNTGKVVVTVGMAPSRNAFLLLVQTNVFNMAVRFMEGGKNDPGKVKRLRNDWEKIGGNWSSLVNAINQGYRRAGRQGTFIGEPGTTAAIITAAAAALAALAGVIREFGIQTKSQSTQEQAAANKALLDAAIAAGGGGSVQTKADGVQLVTLNTLPKTIYDRQGERIPTVPTYVTPGSAYDTQYTEPLPPYTGTQSYAEQAALPPAASTFDFGTIINNVGNWINNNPVPVTVGVGTAAIIAFSNSKIFSTNKTRR